LEKNVELKPMEKFNKKFFTLNTLTSGLTTLTSMVMDAIEERNNSTQEANKVKNDHI
jgi:hypothetical protein